MSLRRSVFALMNNQDKQQDARPLVLDADKDIPFADFVRAVTNADIGIILSFAQLRPQTQKTHVVGEVMLPMKVAADTAMMLLRQIVEAERATGRKFFPDTMQITEQRKQTST